MDTKKFWENRLSKGISLQTTGHRAFSLDYNRWLYQAQVDCLEDLLGSNCVTTRDRSYLDVGSGGGFFIEYFAGKGASPINGIDIARPSVDYLQKEYPFARFFQADVSDPNLPVSGEFEIISAISVLFHIVDDQKFNQAIQNFIRLLAPGGYLILCDTFEPSGSFYPVPKHVRMRMLDSYEANFKPHNIEVLDIRPMYYSLNRVYLPWLGPKVINALRLGRWLYNMDSNMRKQRKGNWGGVKLLLARKSGA